jgi:5-methylcytosine-specific restriction protein A
MSSPRTIASQADVAARELAALIELLDDGPAGLPIADAIEAVESVGRLTDCARVRVLAPLIDNVTLAERLGAASPIAAVASLARISERSARARLKVSAAVCGSTAITGAPLPAPHPVVSDALRSGELGLDAATLIAAELASIAGRTTPEVLDIAESVMVGLATGVGPTGEPIASAVSVDHLGAEIRQVAAAADPDGARPREERAQRRRDFRVGSADEDGLVPVSGRLMPEVGSLLTALLEAHRRSPRFLDPDASLASADDLVLGADPRTPGQRRHDAVGEILVGAAASDGAPRLDGQPVTVLVTVSAADLVEPNGLDGDAIGTMAGSPFPVSRRSIERFIDAGGYRVITTDENGAVTAISSPQRCFTPMQRMAIAARDGLGCFNPGCTSPHYSLQAHHVIPDRDDGPTAIDNGILLCYWHHLIVDTGPWQYRMIDGVPHVRGPGIAEWTRGRGSLAHAA